MEPPISMIEEGINDEDDQENDGEELVIPKTAHRTPLPLDHRRPDVQNLGHEWFTECDIPWS
jgi:hypothetical protein